MIEIIGDMWDTEADARCITTNGFVKTNGECVMGRGNALQAKLRYPKLPKLLGDAIKQFGNRVHYFREYELFSFPTKHNWWEKADINLIKSSYQGLISELNYLPNIHRVLLPRPGVESGQLDWEKEVKPILWPLSDDRIIIISL